MYDIFTNSVIFFLLFPGVLVSLPSGTSPLLTAVVMTAVFYVINVFVSPYVPAWGIWTAAAVVVIAKIFMSRRAETSYNPIAEPINTMVGGMKKLFK